MLPHETSLVLRRLVAIKAPKDTQLYRSNVIETIIVSLGHLNDLNSEATDKL